MKKTLIVLMMSLPCFAESQKLKTRATEAEIKETAKWNVQFQKLAAAERLATSRKSAFIGAKAKECESSGQILNIVPNGVWFGCVAKPEPPPRPAPQPPAVPDKKD